MQKLFFFFLFPVFLLIVAISAHSEVKLNYIKKVKILNEKNISKLQIDLTSPLSIQPDYSSNSKTVSFKLNVVLPENELRKLKKKSLELAGVGELLG